MASHRFSALRSALRGAVIELGDPGYDDARILHNAMITTRPAAIAKVTGPEDIAAAIRFARDHDVPLAVRAGGHSVAGHSLVEDGLVIDLRLLKSIVIDTDARTARVGGGVTWGELDKASQVHGLATTGGRVTTTGVAGYTLGGGNGWLDRTFGLAADNLLSVDLVTADGRQVTASATEHPDLFWAVRGSGANFGVATAFTFRLHPVGTVYAGMWLFDAERGDRGPGVTRTYRDLMADAPRTLGGGLLWMYAPPDEMIPAPLRGRLCVAVAFCHVGDAAEGEKLAAPLRAHAPDLDAVGPVPYADFNSSFDDPPGLRNYWTAEYLHGFGDPALDLFVDRSRALPAGTRSMSAIIPAGGAVADIGDDDTPLGNREAPWHLHPFCAWERPEDDDACIGWGRGMRAAFQPFATGGVYLNFVGDEGHERVIAGFGRKKYEKLARIKAAWDPDNVFRRNQNIVPQP